MSYKLLWIVLKWAGFFFFSVTRKNISVLHGTKCIIYPTLRKFEIVLHLSKAEIKTLFSTKNRWVPLDVIVILSFCNVLWISCKHHHRSSVLMHGAHLCI